MCTTTITTILQPFVPDYPCELVPEETFTHSHLSCSSRSTAFSLFILCSSFFTNHWHFWHAGVDPWSTLTCQIWFKSAYLVTVGGNKPQILPHVQFWHAVMCHIVAYKVEHRCTTTNLPLSNDIKIRSIVQCHLSEVEFEHLLILKLCSHVLLHRPLVLSALLLILSGINKAKLFQVLTQLC